VKIGKETEEAMWANVKSWDKEQEAISNKKASNRQAVRQASASWRRSRKTFALNG